MHCSVTVVRNNNEAEPLAFTVNSNHDVLPTAMRAAAKSIALGAERDGKPFSGPDDHLVVTVSPGRPGGNSHTNHTDPIT